MKCNRHLQYIVITIATLLISSGADAQIISRSRAKKDEPAPKAILVQLPTYQRRTEALLKTNDKARMEQLKKDRDSFTTKIVMDFEDNLTYCPVYFFYDKDIDKIKSKQLEGILLNSKLQPVESPVISGVDSNFFIVMFGHPVISGENKNGTQVMSVNQSASDKQALQVFDHNYIKLKNPLPNGSNNAWGGHSKKSKEDYKYKSPVFDIYYIPYVTQYNAKLHTFYGNYPY